MEARERALHDFVLAQESGGFAGQADAGAGSEAEVPHRGVELLRAHPLSHPDHADVARLGDHVLKGQGREDFVVVDADAIDLDEAVSAIDDFEGRHHTLLKAGGRGDDLEDAARFVGVGHRAVHPVAFGEGGETIRIEGGEARHGEHFARARIHHHGHAGDGARVADGFAQSAFSVTC
jgi:hypothetical protein